MTQRRFVHRSVREHLVADQFARILPAAGEAAGELLNHLWFDPDWEDTAPASLAMHPQRDQVLAGLIRRVIGGDQTYAHLKAVDGCQEIRRFLARVAQESGEDDWPPEQAQMIGQARMDIAAEGPASILQIAATDWPTSNQLILRPALGLLTAETDRLPRRWQRQ